MVNLQLGIIFFAIVALIFFKKSITGSIVKLQNKLKFIQEKPSEMNKFQKIWYYASRLFVVSLIPAFLFYLFCINEISEPWLGCGPPSEIVYIFGAPLSFIVALLLDYLFNLASRNKFIPVYLTQRYVVFITGLIFMIVIILFGLFN